MYPELDMWIHPIQFICSVSCYRPQRPRGKFPLGGRTRWQPSTEHHFSLKISILNFRATKEGATSSIEMNISLFQRQSNPIQSKPHFI